jgi:hypothetical protein
MEKKKYMKPSMKVYDMPDSQRILCYSQGFNYIPAIPGQHEDEKQLA